VWNPSLKPVRYSFLWRGAYETNIGRAAGDHHYRRSNLWLNRLTVGVDSTQTDQAFGLRLLGLWLGVFGVTPDNSFRENGGDDETRTRDLCRDRTSITHWHTQNQMDTCAVVGNRWVGWA
jgi:hypothetical protein